LYWETREIKGKKKFNENIHIFSACPTLPSKEMTKFFCVGVAPKWK
jgi:hypothetical protein